MASPYRASEYLKSQHPEITDEMWDKYIMWVTYAIDSQGTNFQSQLIRLALKADSGNREKFRLGFPLEVMLAKAWALGEIEMVPFNPEDKK